MKTGIIINRVLFGSIEFLSAGESVEIIERVNDNFLIRKIGYYEVFSCPSNNLVVN
ncbi:MAG: hypothetical protein MUF45_00460 [Spirosomaceae bacterium]|jgi:hypothetical protein|nr:hypothetical protein [Spirosomataceae bacterium]